MLSFGDRDDLNAKNRYFAYSPTYLGLPLFDTNLRVITLVADVGVQIKRENILHQLISLLVQTFEVV